MTAIRARRLRVAKSLIKRPYAADRASILAEMVEPLWMSPGRAAVVTSTDKSMPAAPANSGGCGCSDADAPQLSRMLGLLLYANCQPKRCPGVPSQSANRKRKTQVRWRHCRRRSSRKVRRLRPAPLACCRVAPAHMAKNGARFSRGQLAFFRRAFQDSDGLRPVDAQSRRYILIRVW